MKKNLVFKLGLFCAALVLVATCFVTNAWAKYTKTVNASDSARVAKFTVEANHNGSDVLHEAFTLDIFTTELTNIYKDTGGKNINTEKLIAPGSHGQFVVEHVSDSEVAVQFTMSASVTNANSIPVQWSLIGTTAATDWTADLNALLGTTTHTIEADDDAGNNSKPITIYWRWVYEGGNDNADTALGEAGTATYTVALTVTATQVQPTPVPAP